MKTKRLLAASMAATLSLSLAACGSNGASSSKASSSGSDSSGTKEKVVLEFYDWTDEQVYLDPAIEAYNKQSDIAEVRVTYFPPTEYADKILASFSSKTQFDVLGVNGIGPYGQYQDKNLLVDLSTYVKDSNVDTSVYGNVFEQSNTSGIFGLPYRQSVWLLFVNPDIFAKAGLEVPKEQLTWTEYRELAKKLTVEGETYGGLLGMDNWVLMQQLGGSVMDDNTSIIRQSLELWKAIDEDGTHVPFAEKLELGQNAGSLFKTDPANIAMFQNGTWGVAALNTAMGKGELPFKYTVMPMPVPDGAKDYTAPSGMNFLSVSSTSKNPEAAYDFIKFMCGAEGAGIIADYGTLTAYSDDAVQAKYLAAANQADDTLANIVFSRNNVIEQKYDEKYSATETALREEFELYMIGEQDIDTTMKKFEERRAEIVKE